MPMAMSADASNRAPAERVSGETIQHLGRQYRPKLHKSAADAVKLIGRFLARVAEKAIGEDSHSGAS